jgi:hypothetical protein
MAQISGMKIWKNLLRYSLTKANNMTETTIIKIVLVGMFIFMWVVIKILGE